jgi:iron(II)-dependent oxidoreductase
MSASPHKSPDKVIATAATPRPPYLMAALVCLVAATAIGSGGWFLFTRRPVASADKPLTPTSPDRQPTPDGGRGVAPPPAPTPAVSVEASTSGLVFVPGGEVIIGGSGTDEPVQKTFVEPFSISETEITNAQYAVYVRESQRGSAAGWKGGEFRSGTAQEPVRGVTWHDAADYCSWLGQKLGSPARLPTEVEWMRAARGDQNHKYPWGNEWRDDAAASREGRVRAVKSYPSGVSPFGAYDMAGNVWEWVADDGQKQIEVKETGQVEVIRGKVVKGGAALEKPESISAVARGVAPPDEQNEWLGFRCIVPRPGAK